MSKNDDALRCAKALRQLDDAKKYHPTGPGGQMCGSESYRLVASGFSFYELQNAADHLDRLTAENEAQDALLRQAVEAMEGVIYWDNEKPEWQDARTAIAAIRQQPAPQPPTDDEKDAARYRWLRDGCNEKGSRASHIAANFYGMEWDAEIDAAIERAHGIKEQP